MSNTPTEPGKFTGAALLSRDRIREVIDCIGMLERTNQPCERDEINRDLRKLRQMLEAAIADGSPSDHNEPVTTEWLDSLPWLTREKFGEWWQSENCWESSRIRIYTHDRFRGGTHRGRSGIKHL